MRIWLVDGVVIDMVDGHRGRGSGYPAGETASDRYPQALLNLFLQAGGGGGDQFPSGLVKQQDRRGVNTQQLTNSAKQLGEQVVDV